MGDRGNLGNRKVMDERLRNAALNGNLVSFVEGEKKIYEKESGTIKMKKKMQEYLLSETEYTKSNILHLAIRREQKDFIKKVFKGNDEELLLTDELIKQQDSFGDTLFKLLFEYQQEAAVLTPAGFSMQNRYGNTPLHIALISGKDEVATFLAKHCSDLTRSRKNNDGNTPLHVAAQLGNIECSKLLLEYDHNQAEVKNRDGNTPLHVAFLNSRHDIATLLFERCPHLARVTSIMKETPLHLVIEQSQQIIASASETSLEQDHQPVISQSNTVDNQDEHETRDPKPQTIYEATTATESSLREEVHMEKGKSSDFEVGTNKATKDQASEETPVSESPKAKLLEKVISLCERLELQTSPDMQIKLSLQLMDQVRILGENDPVNWEDLSVACQTCAAELAQERPSFPPLMVSEISQQVPPIFQQQDLMRKKDHELGLEIDHLQAEINEIRAEEKKLRARRASVERKLSERQEEKKKVKHQISESAPVVQDSLSQFDHHGNQVALINKYKTLLGEVKRKAMAKTSSCL